jgi:hypothetical protein
MRKTPHLLAAMLLSPVAASAQLDAPRCTSDIARLAEVTAAQDYANTLGWIRRCPQSGPAAVAAVWDTIGDGWRLGLLIRITREFYDERVLRTLLRIVGEETRSNAVRLAAVRALVGQVGHCLDISQFPTPVPHGDSLVALVSIAMWTHSGSSNGTVPRDGVVADRVLKALRHPPDDPALRALYSGTARELARPQVQTLCQ